MTGDLYFRLILGHLVGDYLLQPQWMAEQKAEGGRGLWLSLLHSAIYTACICMFLGSAAPWLAIGVFIAHWPVDRYSLADKWLALIRGRRIAEAMRDITEKREARIAFACIVYVAVDNGLHLLLMWVLLRILGMT